MKQGFLFLCFTTASLSSGTTIYKTFSLLKSIRVKIYLLHIYLIYNISVIYLLGSVLTLKYLQIERKETKCIEHPVCQAVC